MFTRCLIALLCLTTVACDVRREARPRGAAQVHGRDVVITAVPLLTREMVSVYPFLKQDFAAGGALEGKEVYAFVPASVTAFEGDTLRLDIFNPEDDAHTFVLPDLSLKLPPQSRTQAVWIARRAGVYPFYCVLPQHMPMMHGEIVVLPKARAGF